MTDEPPTHPFAANAPEPGPSEPVIPVDPLDERLSAEIDGAEIDGAAAPGESSDDPRAGDRRRALISARDLLAIPPPPLDDVTRRRMLRTAVAELPVTRRRDLRSLNRVAVAAAVLAVLVIGGVALKALGDGSGNKAKRASNGAAAPGPALGAARNLHEVSDPEVLRSRVESLLRAEAGAAAAPTSTVPPHSDTVAPDGPDTSKAQDRVAADGCLSAVRVPPGVTPSVLAEATFGGAPAVVIVAHDGPRTLVFVLARADCRLLSSQFLKE